MGDTPTTGSVSVSLKLDTAEAISKAEKVERQLRKNEQERKDVSQKITRDGLGARTGGKVGGTIADKIVDKITPRVGSTSGGALYRYINRDITPKQQIPTPNMVGRAAVSKVLGQVNPFPSGGVSGENLLGGVGATLALAAGLYAALDIGAKVVGMGRAYRAQSGQRSVGTPVGQFFNELNSTFSYINNYVGAFRDAETRLADFDDAVGAVSGKLPETELYRSQFQKMATNERAFQDMIKRNASLTHAGAMGASNLSDQIQDIMAHGLSR